MEVEQDEPTETAAARRDAVSILQYMALIAQAGGYKIPREAAADLRDAATILRCCVHRLNRRRKGGELDRRVLTPRERTIARQLGLGRAYKDIAAELNLGLSGIQAAVKSIYLKLGVHSRAEVRVLFDCDRLVGSGPT